MPHTKVSRALADVRRQLCTGKTRGKRPRPLSPEEVQALQQKLLVLEAELARLARERVLARIHRGTQRVVAVPVETGSRAPPEIGCGFP